MNGWYSALRPSANFHKMEFHLKFQHYATFTQNVTVGAILSLFGLLCDDSRESEDPQKHNDVGIWKDREDIFLADERNLAYTVIHYQVWLPFGSEVGT